MFSRSEKTEEVIDPMAEPSEQRSPMVLAALAGLLAIAGAFMLVWYLSNGSDDVAADGQAQAASNGAEGGAAAADPTSRQVLVVTQTIPRGTSIVELIEAPTVYLSARAVPEQFVAASAITSVAELNELTGMVLASDALPGEQLLRGRFRDPNDFGSSDETFLEAETQIDIPAGHHAVVLELPSSRAMGGNIRAGEQVTIVGSFGVTPIAEGFSRREVSVVVINSVEVLNIESSLEVAGQISSDINAVGIANRGSYTITVAVAPEELTDLTYAISYGELFLATAVEGLDNEDGPRAATGMAQMLGEDGVWVAEAEDGNLIDYAELFPVDEEAIAESIELDLPDPTEDDDDIVDDDVEPSDPNVEVANDGSVAGDS